MTVQGEAYQHCSSLHIVELPQIYYIWVIYIYTSLRERQGCLRTSFMWMQSCWWGSPAFCRLCLPASFCRAVIKCQPVMQPHIFLGFLIFLNYHFIYLLGPSSISFQYYRCVCFQCFILQKHWMLAVRDSLVLPCCLESFLMWFSALL